MIDQVSPHGATGTGQGLLFGRCDSANLDGPVIGWGTRGDRRPLAQRISTMSSSGVMWPVVAASPKAGGAVSSFENCAPVMVSGRAVVE